MQNIINHKRCLLLAQFVLFLCLSSAFPVQAQSDFAYGLIAKSLNSLTDNDTYAIHFEGLAQGLNDPKQIFRLPSNEIDRGGYMYMDKGRFELKMGTTKGLSDGKQVVFIDESEQMMWVDSVRTQVNIPGLSKEQIQIEQQKAMNDMFGSDSVGPKNCTYLGKEMLNKRMCHKVKADFKGSIESHFLYWIDVNTQQMVLMGEWTGDNYNAYWIKSIHDTAPKGHVYAVNLPSTRIDEFYGFEVVDNRFIKTETEREFLGK